MNMITDKKKATRFILLLTSAYMVSYIARINYGAVISEMVRAEQLSKSALSVALTGSFVSYGLGQIISGFFGDRIQPKKLVLGGFAVTACMNLLIVFCKNPVQTAVVWTVNGMAQAFMWPPMVRLMSELLTPEDYRRACVVVSWGSSAGTVLVYLISPLLISLSGWRAVFVFAAAAAALMACLWTVCCPNVSAASECGAGSGSLAGIRPLINFPMLSVMVGIILMGVLRDGVTTWMPSLVSESFGIAEEISILSGVLLPLFGMVCFAGASSLYRRVFRDPVTCAGVIFAAGFAAALTLVFIVGKNAAVSVLSSALLTGCMHGVNLMLICMVPQYFAKYGNVSLISGILNSGTYIGSALSAYGTAAVTEAGGWGVTAAVWAVCCAVGTVLLLTCAKSWRAKYDTPVPASEEHRCE